MQREEPLQGSLSEGSDASRRRRPTQVPEAREGKSPGKNGKAKAKHTHSVVFKTVPSAKGIVSRLEEAPTSNSVTSEPSVSLSLGVQRVNSVLSAGNRQSKASLHTRNVFSCDSIHNTGDSTLDQCQTDTDPSGCLCILADIHVRARTTSRTHYIRVKADPGADAQSHAFTPFQSHISLSV